MSGLGSATPTQLAVLTPSDGAPVRAAGDDKPFSLFGDDGFSFSDFIDIINPLQHIPVLSTLYRQLTGDTIDAGPRVMGGTLFGGPIGAVASLINVFVEESTGKDLGEHAVALLTDEEPASEIAVARGGVCRKPVSRQRPGAPASPWRQPWTPSSPPPASTASPARRSRRRRGASHWRRHWHRHWRRRLHSSRPRVRRRPPPPAKWPPRLPT